MFEVKLALPQLELFIAIAELNRISFKPHCFRIPKGIL